MEREENRCAIGCVILSFLVGGLAGAGVALLVAPKTGETTRRMIRELAEDTKAKAEDWIEEVKDKASGYVKKGKQFVEQGKDVISQ